MLRMRSRSSLVRTGWLTSRRMCSPESSRPSRLGRGTDQRHQRHHEFFADRVDRRVGDLREVLLEIVRQRLRLVRQHAGGLSVPIEPIASWPVNTIGVSRTLTSSCV